MDEILLIDKPSGMTSFGVVARIRRVLTNQHGKKVKVGHTGTLDPFATGLMILVVGKECKNAASYSKLDKIYESTIKLGQVSTTGDPEGEITNLSDDIPDVSQVKDVLKQFVGEITQTPPIYSAIKINGERAYDLARAGKQPEMPQRQVAIYSIELISYNYPYIKIRAHVSSGTYIRTLAEDIGKLLETGAYCIELRRTRIADWSVDSSKKIDDYGITD